MGYTLSILGLIGLSLTFDKVKEITQIKFLESITNFQMMIISVVVIVMGIILLRGKKSSQSKGDIPIYQGKKVIGYRRE